MKQIRGGVTAAKGFEAAGVEAAIKYQNRKDMALIVSKAPCTVAGTFTSNVVKAAPVLWDKQIVENSAYAQAVVVNSGIANACTGRQVFSIHAAAPTAAIRANCLVSRINYPPISGSAAYAMALSSIIPQRCGAPNE